MSKIFDQDVFAFPYLYKFPGQATDEKILFITRESGAFLWLRRLVVTLSALLLAILGAVLATALRNTSTEWASLLEVSSLLISIGFATIGWWWVGTLWKYSLALVTTKRLVKFISTTPWNRHNLSLPLDMIVDTGAYSKGFLEALFRLGTFTARSSASSSGVATDDPGRVNKKYFYIEHIAAAEDLHHYVNKLLFAQHRDWTKLETYRPFLPYLKGDARKKFMENYPEYWS